MPVLPREPHSARGRRAMPAGRVLVVMLVCLFAWSLLFAPRLRQAAEAQPLGLRRSVSLSVLAPFVWASDLLHLTGVTDSVEEALGRDPNAPPGGDLQLAPDPLPTIGPSGIGHGTHHGHHGGQAGQGDAVDTVKPIRVPSEEKKLRVVVVGDSLAAGIGYFAERVFEPSLVRVSRQGRISTGLARPDYFDWQAAMRQIVVAFDPDLVIVLIGENDNQSLQTSGGRSEIQLGTAEWPPAYQERVEGLMRVATSRGARVVWVGLPVQRDTSRWVFVRRENDIYREASEHVGDVAYLDAWDLFDAPEGGYTAFYRVGNEIKLVRGPDGVHFNPDGYTILMHAVADLAHDEFGLSPKTFA